jgi:hypothetical protein
MFVLLDGYGYARKKSQNEVVKNNWLCWVKDIDENTKRQTFWKCWAPNKKQKMGWMT